MAHIKDLFLFILDLFGYGSISIHILAFIDLLVSDGQNTLSVNGLTPDHETILFWFTLSKGILFALFALGFAAMKIYVFYRDKIKK